jgi:hypothetical protein
MAFKSLSVALGTSNTDVVECPSGSQGAAVLSINNITAGALTYALKLYRQATGQTVTVASGVSVAANTSAKYVAPISLEAGDKIIMTSSSANNLLVTGTFTYSASTPAAVGFTPRGPWDSGATYDTNDIVSKNFNSYVAIQESTNQDPETQTAYWMLSAGRGASGAGDLSAANNLSDLASAATARTNLGLGTGDTPLFTGVSVTNGALYPGIPIQDKSAAYTGVIGDANTCLRHPASDANNRTFTIPANSSVAYPIGTVLAFLNEINTVTIAITMDTLVFTPTGSTGSRSLAANGMALAIKVASTRWYISGTGIS